MLYSYQQEAVDKLVSLHGRGGLFLDMGTGKTRVALTVARQLGAERILVVGPLSAATIWEAEVRKLNLPLRVNTLTTGSIRNRAQRVGKTTGVLVFVNYEAYWREPLRSALVRSAPDAIIYDEAHRLKSRTTRQSRFAHSLTPAISMALTGTPVANGFEDVFGIFRAVRPEAFGTRWRDFADHYLTMGGYLGYQIVGYRNVAELEAKVAENSFRRRREDVLDLPEWNDTIVSLPLNSYTTYRTMQRNAVAAITGTASDGRPYEGRALARIVLTNLLRLQQITSGFVTSESGTEVDLSDEKDRYLQDLVSDAVQQGEQVVIFCRFTREVDRSYDVVSKLASTCVYDGRTPYKVRSERLKAFQDGRIRCFVTQVATGSLAIDLSCARIAIFRGLSYSHIDHVQARARLHRVGQNRAVTYYYLLAPKTVDEKIYRLLQRKEDLSSMLLDRKRVLELLDNEEDLEGK